MRLFIRKGRSSYPVFVCPAQQFVDSEDFMLATSKHVKAGGNVHHMYVDFENTQIPVTHVLEIRVLSQMAAAYHNACLAQNLTAEKDLYVMLYDVANWPKIETEAETAECSDIVADKGDDTVTDSSDNVKVKQKDRTNQSLRAVRATASGRCSTKQSKKSTETPWDEEVHGERVVFDLSFEINEHLVPWLLWVFGSLGFAAWGFGILGLRYSG
jgi:hypothetical protein